MVVHGLKLIETEFGIMRNQLGVMPIIVPTKLTGQLKRRGKKKTTNSHGQEHDGKLGGGGKIGGTRPSRVAWKVRTKRLGWMWECSCSPWK